MADIFKEVEEDLRRDQAEQAWKKYGRYVIALAVAVVVATAGYQAWTWWDREQRAEASETYAAALVLLERGDSQAAGEAFRQIAGEGGGYATLAAFSQARLAAESGDTAAAVAIWDRLAADASAGPGLRGMATLLAVMHQMDEGDPDDLERRLSVLTLSGDGFRPLALELSAVLAMRGGDLERAKTLYAQVADDLAAPQALRQRASQMLQALGG